MSNYYVENRCNSPTVRPLKVRNSRVISSQGISEKGFTMIEVVIAMLVLMVGLLGIASMQTYGVQATMKSHQQAIAMVQAQDIADRIRTNISGLRSTQYTNAIPGAAPNPTCIALAATCTPAELAATDLFNWQAENAASLPLGQGSITCTDIDAGTAGTLEAGSSCIITLRWDGNRNGAEGLDCSGSILDLACLRMRVML